MRLPGAIPGGLEVDGLHLAAFSRICTHMGCVVSLNRDAEAIAFAFNYRAPGPQLVCRCHLSVFDPDRAGRAVAGPAIEPLPRVRLELDGDDPLGRKLMERMWKGDGGMPLGRVPLRTAPKLKELVKLRNQVATKLGFRDYYALRIEESEQDETQLLKLFDELDALTREPFLKHKAEVDRRLANPPPYTWGSLRGEYRD